MRCIRPDVVLYEEPLNNGNKKILINLFEVPNEDNIDYVLHEKVGEVFEKIMQYQLLGENIYDNKKRIGRFKRL